MTLLVYVQQYTNQVIWKNTESIYDLNNEDQHRDDKAILLQNEIEIAIENRSDGSKYLLVIFAFGFGLCLAGYTKWYSEIQPVHDAILKLQKEKLEFEVDRYKQ